VGLGVAGDARQLWEASSDEHHRSGLQGDALDRCDERRQLNGPELLDFLHGEEDPAVVVDPRGVRSPETP
jgi:hypothetical protein